MNFLSVLYAKAGITVDGVTALNNTATALTPTTSDSSTKIATTAFVKNQNYYPYPTGTTSQYVRGDGSLATFPSVAAEAKTLITEVYNETGATLTKGTVVYINGGHGNLPTVTKALANSDATSAQTYGVVQNDITDNNNGFVVVIGSLTDIPTNGYANGTILYLSPTTAGGWTSTKPYAPQHIVYVGIVVREHPTQGIVEIKIQNGYEMDELHNVSAQSPANGDILQFNYSTQLWTKTAGTTSNIAEGSNLYYTDSRARLAFSESVTGLDYNSTTGVLSTTSGYGIPTTASQATWDTAYNDSIVSAAVTGTTTKTLTLTQQDGGTITASWSDLNTDAVTSVFGRTGAVVAASGDYTTTQVTEGTNLYFTDARARAAISLTTTGTSGAATYSGGVLNIPQYQAALTNPVTGTGTANYVTKWVSGSAVGNSIIYDNGTSVGIGTVSPAEKLHVTGNIKVEQSTNANAYITLNPNSAVLGTGYQWNLVAVNSAASYAFQIREASTAYLHINNSAGTGGGNVGIGTTSPGKKLDVVGTTETSIRVRDTGGAALEFYQQALNSYILATNNFFFYTAGSERMRIDTTGNVSIGAVVPTATLDVRSKAASGSITAPTFRAFGYDTDSYFQVNSNASNSADIKLTRSDATTMFEINGHTGLAYFNGNIGVGVTPSAWTSFSVLQNTGGSLIGAAGELQLWQNAYYDGASKYYATGTATRYGMTAGQHRWYYAVSGTANAALTWVQSMTLNEVGNLGLGIVPTTSSARTIQFGSGAGLGTNSTNNTYFYHNATIDASSNLLYAVTGQQASMYRQINGAHQWLYAAAGTAGNAITFTNNMVLDTAGQLSTVGDATINGVKVGRGAGNIASNTAVGASALLSNTTGSNNTANGLNSLYSNTTGSANTANGAYALFSNTTGNHNTSIGYASLLSNTTGSNNTANGLNSLYYNTTGSSNTAIGRSALFNNTASNNTAVGFEAGLSNTSGANNIFIGYQSTGVSITESNRTWIGNSSTTSTWLAGNVLIGTTTDAGYKLDVNGGVRFTNGTNPYLALYDGTSTSYLQVSGGNLDVRVGGANAITFNTNSAERMRITSAGLVGIGCTDPTGKLEIRGNRSATKDLLLNLSKYDYGATTFYQNYSNTFYTNGKSLEIEVEGLPLLQLAVNNAGSAGKVIFPSGNVLIGTTTDAGYKLDVNGTARVSGQLTVGSNIILPDSQDISWGTGGYGAYKPTISATDGVGIKFYPDGQGSGNTFTINTNGTATFSSSVTASSLIKSGGTSSQYLMADGSTSTLTNPITGTGTTNYLPKFTGTSALGDSNLVSGTNGQLGLGVIPSAWDSTLVRAIQVGNLGGSISSYTALNTGTPYMFVDNNAYYDGTDKYILNRAAARYVQIAGEHQWLNAPSGTAGNAISFTQAMTLNASGNLLIGTTTDAGYKLDVNGTFRAVSGALPSVFNTASGQGIAIENSDSSNKRYRLNVDGTSFLITEAGVGTPLTIASGGAATFSSSVNATSFTANNRTILTSGGLYDNATNGNNIGIGFGAGYIISTTGDGTYAAQSLGNATYPWASATFNGNVNIKDNYALNLGYNHAGGAYILYNSNGNLDITPRSGYNTIFTTGNVGIGTTSPSRTLSVNGQIGLSDDLIATNSTNVARFGYNAYYSSSGFNLTTENSIPLTFGTASTERMRITSAGNVGIGTTSPNTKLDVSGSISLAGTDGLRIGSVGDNSAYDNVKLYYSGYNGGAPRVYLTPRTTPGSGVVQTYFHLLNSNGASTTSNNTMGLLVDGSVGIGTASPGYKLDVNGTARVSGDLSIQNSAGTLQFVNGTGNNWQIYKDNSNNLQFYISGGGPAINLASSGAATFSSSVTATSFSGAGTGLTGTASALSIGGSAGTAGYTTGTAGGAIRAYDLRTIAPNSMSINRMGFGFTSFNNNNTSPWADYIHLRSYGDSTGGADNLIVFNKSTIGMRIYQQTFGSSTAYSSYKDIAFTDGTNASGTWGISITGNANYATTAGALTSMNISQFTNDSGYITSTSSTFSYTASVTLSPTWQNTGVSSANLTGSGVYIVTCNANDFGVSGGQYNCTYTGIMYWFAGGTNGSNVNEIVLHHTGHADNGRYIYLRTINTVSADGKTYLQISGNGTNSGASNYQLTFKKIL